MTQPATAARPSIMTDFDALMTCCFRSSGHLAWSACAWQVLYPASVVSGGP